MSARDLLGDALEYAARFGWHVFPVSPKTKRPLIEHGLHAASTNPEQIRRWWGQFPRAMIGCATGEVSGFDALDVDVDPTKGIDGEKSLAKLVNGTGLPPTVSSRTPRGGRHLFFRHREGLRNSASKVGPGLDVRADGGYVILPPSINADGKAYTWLTQDLAFYSWPEALLPNDPARLTKNSSRAASTNSSAASSAYSEKALENECRKVAAASVGMRNTTLNSAAFNLAQLVAGGCLDETSVRRRLAGAAISCGLDQEEIAPTIESGFSAGMARPRAGPEPRQRNGASEGWQDAERPQAAKRAALASAPHAPFVIASAADLQGKPVPDRNWLVPDIIPAGNVTLLSGDGGVGKSTLALQLAAAFASEQSSWIGRITAHGKALDILCEDDADEVHRRLAAIAAHMGCRFSDLSRLSYSVRVGGSNLLMNFDRSHAGKTTPFYDQIGNAVVENQIGLLILDSLHDFYGGEEINRSEARQFINAVRAIAQKGDCAVVLLGHPSLAGIANNTGTSGSTGWNNTARARCYLHKQDEKDDAAKENDTRVLDIMKSNYGPVAEGIELTWVNGVFMPKAPSFDTFHEAESAFLACLDEATRQGRHVSDAKNSPRFAPKVFAGMRRLNRNRSERQLAAAMEVLFAQNRIRVGEFQNSYRNPVKGIVRVTP